MKKTLLLICVYLVAAEAFSADLAEHRINIQGFERIFYIYTPESAQSKLPVLLAFHGGGGTALNACKQYDFNRLAAKNGYVVIYPQGINNQWNDGRIASAKGKAADDVTFIKEILNSLQSLAPKADTSRVFTAGISNGGFFSIYLASQLNDRIDAIAAVCASIPQDLKDSFALHKPVPLLLIAGTADPLVKYEGGWVGLRKRNTGRGYSMPVDWTVAKWKMLNVCDIDGIKQPIPDNDPTDGCHAEKFTYFKDGKPSVVFIKIENGGHAWPGGIQYLSPRIIGILCKDFSASEEIIGFFDEFR